ncbi:FtsX-like permease family [Streptomyces noursei ATCC 11455]|uniref:FtsX-like permease family protein n=1 Tax=Streptomyces noursei TaxID=1971 RepID=UPI00081CE8BB|nr:FtsX-like permease family [Streptomyces noursei ATCC 11455]
MTTPKARTTPGGLPARLRAALPSAPRPLRAGESPTAVLALGALILVTAFLAAAFPRGVDAYETRGVRAALGDVRPDQRMVEITASRHDTAPAHYAPDTLTHQDAAIRGRLTAAAPLRLSPADAVRGVRTTTPLTSADPGLPRPDGVDPAFSLYAVADLARHATVTRGRLPRPAPVGSSAREAAVTVATARALHLHPGGRLRLGGLTLRISGLLAPHAPEGPYWALDPLLANAALSTGGTPPTKRWRAALLLAPEDGPALLSTAGEPERFWRYPVDTSTLTAGQAPLLQDRVRSLQHGPGLVRLRAVVGSGGLADSALDGLLDGFGRSRDAVAPVVAVAACGIGTVAGVVVLMTGALAAARRHRELALLRARGASLPGLFGRLTAETAAVALPGAAVGCALAVLLVPGERLLPSLLAAAGVGLLGTLALPLRAAAAHRTTRPAVRADLVGGRPSRRRTIAELTVLALSVAAVLALRRRGTGSGGVDALVSAAPVLVAVIAALLLMRLYPLPLRLAARPAARARGLSGFLALARAGRAPAAGLPLLALLVALTTASFGGSVLAGVADARDRAALTAVGADARLTAAAPLPARLLSSLATVPGVRDAVPLRLSTQPADDNGPPLYLVIADADAYARLARATGLGAFDATALADPGGDEPLPALVSPGVRTRFGNAPMVLQPEFGQLVVRPAVVRRDTPAQPGGDFVVVDARSVARLHPDTYADPATAPSLVLLAGHSLDVTALRATLRAHTPASLPTRLTLRTTTRALLADSPLQQGAERLYTASVAAGAGFALLALFLSLLQTAPERARLLTGLRALGLPPSQGRRLLVLEALPQALLAALGGTLTGAATLRLLGPGTDLTPLALPLASGPTPTTPVHLQPDPASLLLPSAALLVLALATSLLQAHAGRRRTTTAESRTGEAG